MGTKKKLGIKEKLKELFLGDEPPATSAQQEENQPRQVWGDRTNVTLKSVDRVDLGGRPPLASQDSEHEPFETTYDLDGIDLARLAEVSQDYGLVTFDENEASKAVGSTPDKSSGATGKEPLNSDKKPSTRKITPKSAYQKFEPKPIPPREVKLTIILLENTVTMAKEMEKNTTNY